MCGRKALAIIPTRTRHAVASVRSNVVKLALGRIGTLNRYSYRNVMLSKPMGQTLSAERSKFNLHARRVDYIKAHHRTKKMNSSVLVKNL